MTLKVHVHYRVKFREVEVLQHLESVKSTHPGAALVRGMQDTFTINGPIGEHHCIVYEPLLWTLKDFMNILPGCLLPPKVLKLTIQQVLLILDYLHTEAGVIHTGS